jgi:hypothetical protein
VTRRRSAVAVAMLVLATLASAMGTAAEPLPALGQQAPRPRLSLTAQTPVVGIGGSFTLKLRVDRNAVPASAEVVVTVYRAVRTRSEFEQTVHDRISRTPLVQPPPYPLTALSADSSGEVTLTLPVADPNQPDPNRIDLGPENNVFPVRVELRERNGTPLDRFTTHLVHFPVAPTGRRLGLALVLPFAAELGLPADGPRRLPSLDRLTAAVQALDAARALPFALAPSPETLATLAALNDDEAAKALESLRRVATDHPVLASPFVPVHVPALLDAGLGDELGSQLNQGGAMLNEVLRTRPDGRTWLATEPLDLEAVDELSRRQFHRIVALDALLEPIPDQSVTLTRPFLLGGLNDEVQAAAADTGMTSYFNDHPNQALQAYHLLADLAVLWLDAPGDDRRAVVAVAPRQWKASRAFLDALSTGLAQSPQAEAISLDTFFSAVDPALTPRGAPLVRDPAVPPPQLGLNEIVSEVRQNRRQLVSLASVTGQSTTTLGLLEQRLLIAQSSDLRSTRQRTAYLEAVETGIADQLQEIEMPQGRSITLTARRGQIPVTFQNRTGSPVNVVVTVQSDKLEFPEGDSRPLELARRNTTERFTVVARTSGAFPLRITLVSPDGNLVIGRGRMTVRSTAASGASVFVSAGAALFLVIWWGRHIVRGRRARRLVPP